MDKQSRAVDQRMKDEATLRWDGPATSPEELAFRIDQQETAYYEWLKRNKIQVTFNGPKAK